MINAFEGWLIIKDIEAVINSTFNMHNRQCSSLKFGEDYLLIRCHISKIKIVAQLRLFNKRFPSLYYNGMRHRFYPGKECTVCSLKENEAFIICMGSSPKN